MNVKKWIVLFVGIGIFFLACKKKSPVPAQMPKSASSGPYFEKVKAIIEVNCTNTCHAPSKGFYSGMPIILENDSDIVRSARSIKSSVGDSITFYNRRMPPSAPLSDSDIAIIRNWVILGGTIGICGIKQP